MLYVSFVVKAYYKIGWKRIAIKGTEDTKKTSISFFVLYVFFVANAFPLMQR